MNEITILLWITIALIGVIAIIIVKLHYKGSQLETEEGSILPSSAKMNEFLSIGKDKINSNKKSLQHNMLSNHSEYTNKNNPISLEPQNTSNHNNDVYIVPEVENNNLKNYEYESQNQLLINYGNTVEKFQEPIKQSQMDIMTQNNKDKTELKDLFTIDELIKESKRKDSEREKESQKIINNENEDLTEIKQSIKNKTEEPLIEEIINEDEKEETSDLINESESDKISTLNTATTTSQKDIEDAITTASNETEEEIESISESENITDVLLNSQETEKPEEEIKEPTLKTPSKVGENSDYELGAPIDDANLFSDDDDDEMDLDYRKDLAKLTNTIKGSKIFQEVKEKFVQEKDETFDNDETYIRNVNEYDEFEPIINETHLDFEDIDYDQRLRQENTRRVFNMAKNSQEALDSTESKIGLIKDKPERDNIKITLNNNETVLKKGDEIIYNHLGETYSSQVYAINGDDISVRYRRKDITIKPSDVKKIY